MTAHANRRPRDRRRLDRAGRARAARSPDHALIVDRGRIVAIVPSADGRPRLRRRASASRLPTHVLIPGPRQRAHARGDEPVARHRRRRSAQRLARAAHLAARRRGSSRRSSSTTARCSPPPRCCAAASPAATTCTSFRTRRARAFLRARHARDARACRSSISRRPTPPTPTATCSAGLAARDALQARAAARVLARAARAVHGGRRDAGRRSSCTRASSTCRSRRTSPRRAHEVDDEPRREHGDSPLARLRSARRRPARRSSRSTPCISTRGDIDAARGARLPRRALPGVEHEARAAASRRSRRCSRAASTSRSAPTAPRRTTASTCSARCGSRRCSPRWRPATPPRCRRSDGAARWRRSAARARSASTRAIGSLVAGKEADVDRRRPRPASMRRPATIRCRISSTPSGRERVTDVWVGGERVVADRALHDGRRGGARRARPRSGSERTAMTRRRPMHQRRHARAQRRRRRARRSSRRSRIAGGIRRARVRAAARDQSAAPRLDRARWPAASPASASSTSAAAAAS